MHSYNEPQKPGSHPLDFETGVWRPGLKMGVPHPGKKRQD
jgi:hypothetical protein